MTPYRLAFYDSQQIDTLALVGLSVDFIFGIDIILQFFNAYYDDQDNLITNKNIIMCNYVTSWFIIDFVSVIPISFLINSGRDYTSLARILRLPKLYRLINLTQ